MTQQELATRTGTQDTKTRILDAAEALFVQGGFDALSMRQITASAQVNLAAVNYHFGGKDALTHAVLARRLDPLNEQRIDLLNKLEKSLSTKLTCEHILVAMFLPAERMARSGEPFAEHYVQFLGRAYADPSAVVKEFIESNYLETQGRFFLAFKQALPQLSIDDLVFRLHFAMGALASILAGGDIERLQKELTQGQGTSEAFVLTRLITLMSSALKAPLPGPDDTQLFDDVASVL